MLSTAQKILGGWNETHTTWHIRLLRSLCVLLLDGYCFKRDRKNIKLKGFMTRPTTLKVGDAFRLTMDASGWKSGQIVYLLEDDGSIAPTFVREKKYLGKKMGDVAHHDGWIYILFDCLEPVTKTTLTEMPGHVVHCKTREEYDILMRIYEDAGWVWCAGQKPTEYDGWDGEDCYADAKNHFLMGCIEDAELEGGTIIPLSEFKRKQGLEDRTDLWGKFVVDTEPNYASILRTHELPTNIGSVIVEAFEKYAPSSTTKKGGIMARLRQLSNFVKTNVKQPLKNYYQLGWVEIDENDELIVTEEGIEAKAHAEMVLGITVDGYAKQEVERLGKADKQE